MEIGGIKLSYLGHSGFLINNGKSIAIDPYNVSGAITEKVDLILITHSHYDHCSIKDIEKLSKYGTIIAVPADAQSKITRISGVRMEVVEIGEEFKFEKIKIKTLPAYNIDKKFHPKKEGGMGFLIQIDNTIIYHTGDSDKIPEMEKLTGHGKHGNFFIALLPVSGTYVMSAEEAFEVALMLKPDLCIPMHYGAGVAGTIEDAERFLQLCRQEGLRAEILEKI